MKYVSRFAITHSCYAEGFHICEVVVKVLTMIVSTVVCCGSELKCFRVGWREKYVICIPLRLLASHAVL
jgi:hypothetical protein